MKWLKNFERVQEIQQQLVWQPITEMDPRAYVPEVNGTAMACGTDRSHKQLWMLNARSDTRSLVADVFNVALSHDTELLGYNCIGLTKCVDGIIDALIAMSTATQ